MAGISKARFFLAILVRSYVSTQHRSLLYQHEGTATNLHGETELTV